MIYSSRRLGRPRRVGLSRATLTLKLSLLFALAGAAAGCAGPDALLSAFVEEDLSVHGTWTGRVVSVVVVDYGGRKYEAAALRIESGPQSLRSSGGSYTLRDEEVPLLIPRGLAVVPPAKLGVAAGDRVRVRGKMMSAGVGVAVDDGGPGQVFKPVTRLAGEPPGAGLVILLRAMPEAMEIAAVAGERRQRAAVPTGVTGQAAGARPTPQAEPPERGEQAKDERRRGAKDAGGDDGEPGRVRVDLSGPIAAVRSYAEAWRDGDAAKFMACAYAADDKEREGLRLYARWIASSARLERAAAKAYGAEGAERVREAVPLPLPSPAAYGRQILAELEDHRDDDVTVEGDRASVSVEAAGALQLRRVGKQWRVILIVEDEGVAAAGAAGPDTTPVWNAVIRAQEAVAAGVSAGEYKTADDAAEALRVKIEAAIGDEAGGADTGKDGKADGEAQE